MEHGSDEITCRERSQKVTQAMQMGEDWRELGGNLGASPAGDGASVQSTSVPVKQCTLDGREKLWPSGGPCTRASRRLPFSWDSSPTLLPVAPGPAFPSLFCTFYLTVTTASVP